MAEKAFNTTYKDPNAAVQHFISYLNWCHDEWNKDRPVVAPYVPVIQSSGYGKTRMIAKVAQKVHVLYICKRSENSTGFPPASPQIDWVLNQLVNSDPSLENFSVIMLAVAEEIRSRKLNASEFWKMQIEDRSKSEEFWNCIKSAYDCYFNDENSRNAAKAAIEDVNFLTRDTIGADIGRIQLTCCLDEAHELIDEAMGANCSLKF
ncbi:uncharacterized protein VTP21DRAFT_11746 [Calcarisporiella thermophila]|uniref:uncharacterized protein n=1 Tax=Calcarisporiella thermophila TaxID=911321 RepID=UPI0037432B91